MVLFQIIVPDDLRSSWSDGKAYVPKFRRIDGFGILVRRNASDELRRRVYFIRGARHIVGYRRRRKNRWGRFICGNPWLLVRSLGKGHIGLYRRAVV